MRAESFPSLANCEGSFDSIYRPRVVINGLKSQVAFGGHWHDSESNAASIQRGSQRTLEGAYNAFALLLHGDRIKHDADVFVGCLMDFCVYELAKQVFSCSFE